MVSLSKTSRFSHKPKVQLGEVGGGEGAISVVIAHMYDLVKKLKTFLKILNLISKKTIQVYFSLINRLNTEFKMLNCNRWKVLLDNDIFVPTCVLLLKESLDMKKNITHFFFA